MNEKTDSKGEQSDPFPDDQRPSKKTDIRGSKANNRQTAGDNHP